MRRPCRLTVLRHATPFALVCVLAGVFVASGVAAQDNTPSQPDGDGEVERLRGLLQRYHRDSRSEAPITTDIEAELISAEPPPSQRELDERLAIPFSGSKVLLRDDELGLLVERVQARLDDPRLEDRRNDAPMIGSVQSRENGSLVGNATFSFSHLGKHQYLARIALRSGRNTLTVSDEQWRVDLADTGATIEHLIILYAPPIEKWELQAVSALALQSSGDSLPAWLTEDAQTAAETPATP